MDPNESFDGEEVVEIKSYIQNGNLSGAFKRIKDYLRNLEYAPLNIAVTGESGTGKSTFINTFLGLSGDKAAKTGVTETTMEPKAYSHPKYENVFYWDLPGIGTPNFKTEDYLDKVNFAYYDFFIIIASVRFRECNIKLAQDIQAKKKKFYFVRSKIGQDMYSCEKKRKKSFCEETILEEIREDCLKGIRKANINSPQVFLIDCFEKDKYDFGALQEIMEKELLDHKRHVFLMSLLNISRAVLEKKREALRQQIWLKTLSCCATSAIPGQDTACDVTIREYRTVFGLDEDSLNKLSQLSGKSVIELKSVVKSQHVIGEANRNTINVVSGGTMGAVMLAQRFSIGFAAFGALAVGGVSCYVRMYQTLNQFLFDAAEDAQRVLEKALEDQF